MSNVTIIAICYGRTDGHELIKEKLRPLKETNQPFLNERFKWWSIVDINLLYFVFGVFKSKNKDVYVQ